MNLSQFINQNYDDLKNVINLYYPDENIDSITKAKIEYYIFNDDKLYNLAKLEGVKNI